LLFSHIRAGDSFPAAEKAKRTVVIKTTSLFKWRAPNIIIIIIITIIRFIYRVEHLDRTTTKQ